MKILPIKISLHALNGFEAEIWGIFSPLLAKIPPRVLSDKSSIERGLGIDVFLNLLENDFVLYISITEDRVYLNSKYFDIYSYPETNRQTLAILMEQIIYGRYSIILGYDNASKLISRKLIFEEPSIQGFNQQIFFSWFRRSVIQEKTISGINFLIAEQKS
jgi:hypothetical protein